MPQKQVLTRNLATLLALALLIAIAAACGGAQTTPAPPTAASTQPTSAPSGGQMTHVTLVLQWVVQSQFAGYFAALDKGYYHDEGLDLTIKPGGSDIAPAQVVASGGAEFGVGWLPGRILVPREGGAKVVSIAQVFQRTADTEVSWKESNITKPEDWKGKKVGSWLQGNEADLFAAMRKVGTDPEKDVTIVKQDFNMNALLNHEIDAAQAMTYNEYAQILETVNPKTGKLYQPEDLNVIKFSDVGTGMLQDAIMAREDWLADSKNQDTAVKFLKASYKGWIYCRDNFDDCVNIVLKNGTTLGKGHMTWQLNEINSLIWPSPNGIGTLDPAAYAQTLDIATKYGVLKNKPDANAVRTDLAQKALDAVNAAGLDTKGAGYQKKTIQVTKGGE